MAPFVLMEVLIFAVTVPVIAYFLISKKMIFPVIASALASTVLEIVNERVFAGQGTYYPASLLLFPGFAFPTAIVLLSVFYCCIVNLAALKISKLSADRRISLLIFAVSLAALNLFSLAIEKAGLASGYWLPRYHGEMSLIYGSIYLFYLTVVLSGSFFFIRKIMQQERSDH